MFPELNHAQLSQERFDFLEKRLNSPQPEAPPYAGQKQLVDIFNSATPDILDLQNREPGSFEWAFGHILPIAIETRYAGNYGIAAALQVILPESAMVSKSKFKNRLGQPITLPHEFNNPPTITIFGRNWITFDSRAHAESETISLCTKIWRPTPDSVHQSMPIILDSLAKQGDIMVTESTEADLNSQYTGLHIRQLTSLSPCPKCAVETVNVGADEIIIANPDLFAGAIHPSVEAYLRFKLTDENGNPRFDQWYQDFQNLVNGTEPLDEIKNQISSIFSTDRRIINQRQNSNKDSMFKQISDLEESILTWFLGTRQNIVTGILGQIEPLIDPEILNYIQQVINPNISQEDIQDTPWSYLKDLWKYLGENQNFAFSQSSQPSEAYYLPPSITEGIQLVFEGNREQIDKMLKAEEL